MQREPLQHPTGPPVLEPIRRIWWCRHKSSSHPREDDGWGAPRISTADDNGWRAAGADDGWGVPQQQAKPSVEWERPLPEEPWWWGFEIASHRMMRVGRGIWKVHVLNLNLIHIRYYGCVHVHVHVL